MVLICISLMTDDSEHLSTCLLVIFGEMSIQVSCPFLNKVI